MTDYLNKLGKLLYDLDNTPDDWGAGRNARILRDAITEIERLRDELANERGTAPAHYECPECRKNLGEIEGERPGVIVWRICPSCNFRSEMEDAALMRKAIDAIRKEMEAEG